MWSGVTVGLALFQSSGNLEKAYKALNNIGTGKATAPATDDQKIDGIESGPYVNLRFASRNALNTIKIRFKRYFLSMCN